ncbi:MULTISPECIES: hypothetical protein [Arsenicicoccus]|uniref:hypothetical protein n=1 Tax=Arsenicicoccus TaxID=267408 RepID=UPI002579B047|nr:MULTISPECIES: hypothetical protein [Arsenicicoccus]
MLELPPELMQLSASRAGVLTRAELLEAGLSTSAIRWRSQGWATVMPGIYCVDARPGTPTSDLALATRIWAGLLHAGQGAVVAGRAAAFLWGLVKDEPPVVDIAVPHRRRVEPHAGWRFTRHRRGVHLPPRPSELPRLQVVDVVLDLAAAADTAADAITPLLDACQKGLTTADHVERRLDGRHRHPHRAILEALLADISSGTTTHLELAYLRDVERAHGLPESVRQFSVPHTGRVADAAYPLERVVIELDGKAGHTGQGAFRDMDRDNAHTVLEWTTLRYGWRQVTREPCAIARQVAAVLRTRGRDQPMPTCHRCRASKAA